jgi:hypothetical protein
MYLGQVDAIAAWRGQPGIAKVVILNPNRELTARRREMLGPQRTRLEKVGVGVDHGSWHEASVEALQFS